MKKVIKESDLHRLITKHISEALEYNKKAKQYFPNYTGDAHSDAGKFVSNNKGDYNFARNDYDWSDNKRRDRFQRLQRFNDTEPDTFDPNEKDEDGANEYLKNHELEQSVDNAIDELTPSFNETLNSFIKNAKRQYPVLNNDTALIQFIWGLKDILTDYQYN